jgi:hypothetical protein
MERVRPGLHEEARCTVIWLQGWAGMPRSILVFPPQKSLVHVIRLFLSFVRLLPMRLHWKVKYMTAMTLEIDIELGSALTTAAAIVSLLESMQQREAYRETEGLLGSMQFLAHLHVRGPQSGMPATFQRSLSLLQSARQSHSWLLLGDVLRYEVTPVLQDWRLILRNNGLSGAADNRPGSES